MATAASAGGESDEKAAVLNTEPSFDILVPNRIALFCGAKTVGYIDVGTGNLPGLVFYTPTKAWMKHSDWKGRRAELRDCALATVDKYKDDKSEVEKIKALAKVFQLKKREALSRDANLTFQGPTGNGIVPNETVARLLLAANKAIKDVLAPACRGHSGVVQG